MNKKARRVAAIDCDTGEFVMIAVPRRMTNGFKDGWLSMSQSHFLSLAKNIRHVDDYRVLCCLLGRLDFQNFLHVSQVDLAKTLGMQRQNVNRSIKRLAAIGCLIEGPRVGVSRTYQFNPHFGWKGSGRGHREALKRAAAAGFQVHNGGKGYNQPTQANEP